MSTMSEAVSKQMTNKGFSLGEWQVMPDLNRLQHKNGLQQKQLEPRLIKLLCYLKANQDRVIDRTELVQELWPRVVVNKNSLTRAVSELRKQLYCSEKTINYIETIPKKGYRLLAEVDAPAKAVAVPIQAPIQIPTQTSSLQGAAVILTLLLGFALLAIDFSQQNKQVTAASSVLLSDLLISQGRDYMEGKISLSTTAGKGVFSDSISAPVISNDQNTYAYIQYEHGSSSIYMGSLGSSLAPLKVYSNNNYLFNLSWSPLGNRLLFANRPNISIVAVYSKNTESQAELYSLNLDTMQASRLLPEIDSTAAEAASQLSIS